MSLRRPVDSGSASQRLPEPEFPPQPRRALLSRFRPPQLIAFVYLLGIALGTILLNLPGVLVSGSELGWTERLFMATSAMCITGLVVVDIGEQFTRFGQVIIIALAQIGGLGIIAFGTMFALLAGRRVNFSERQLLSEQISALNVGGAVALLRTIVLYTVVAEGLGMLLLSWRFVPQFGWGDGLYYALFHSVSAYNNAGFVVMPGGLSQYVQDPLVCGVMAVQVILGGLGFLVQLNLINHWQAPRRHRLLIYSKLTLATTGALLVLGTVIYCALEWNNSATLGPLSTPGKVLAGFFQSLTPRSAGLAPLNTEALTTGSLFVTIGLMFIGANSGSTGGGIKTSTFAILLGSAWNLIRGRTELIAFRRRILPETVVRAGTITTIYTLLVVAAFFGLLITNPALDFTHLLFETVSAAATVGLSMNTTHKLNDPGLLILTVLMYLGRIGPVTFAVALNARQGHSTLIDYPPERDILVG